MTSLSFSADYPEQCYGLGN